MIFCPKILILNILLLAIGSDDSWGEQTKGIPPEAEEVKVELMQEASRLRDRDLYEPAWQENFEILHKQVNDQMAQNARLNIQQKEMEKEIARLQTEVEEKEKIGRELSVQVAELKVLADDKAWETKTSERERFFQQQMAVKNNELQTLQQKISFLDDKTAVVRSKLRMMGVKDNADELLAIQQERDLLEAKLLSQSQREKELMQKILQTKSERKGLDPAVATLRSEMEELSRQIAELEDKQKSVVGPSGFTLKEQVEILIKQKEDMAAENERLLGKIQSYQKNQKLGIENQRIKELVESISAVDAANIRLNEEIGLLRENIAILRTRVKKMEYQAEKLRAMKGK